MANRNPPRISPDEIPGPSKNELFEHIEASYFRVRNDISEIERGRLNKTWVALDTLWMLFPMLDDGVEFCEAKKMLPVEDWKDSTVEVPAALLRELVSSWHAYRESETKTLAQAFGFEHMNAQGSRSMKKIRAQIDNEIKIAKAVAVRYRRIGDEESISKEDALAEVAEIFGISARTAERHYKTHRDNIDRNLRDLEPKRRVDDKTSGSGVMD